MSTLEETMELVSQLSETDQRRVRDFVKQLVGQQHEAIPNRKYRRIAVEESFCFCLGSLSQAPSHTVQILAGFVIVAV